MWVRCRWCRRPYWSGRRRAHVPPNGSWSHWGAVRRCGCGVGALDRPERPPVPERRLDTLGRPAQRVGLFAVARSPSAPCSGRTPRPSRAEPVRLPTMSGPGRAMIERASKHPDRMAAALLALCAYVPILLTDVGRVSADTKSYLTIDPSALLAQATSMWDPSVGAGTVPHQNIGYLFPLGPYYWLMDAIGSPDWFTQRLLWGTIVFAAAFGVSASPDGSVGAQPGRSSSGSPTASAPTSCRISLDCRSSSHRGRRCPGWSCWRPRPHGPDPGSRPPSSR